MPTIKLTDQFGLDLNAQPASTSALLKYFQQLPSLKFDSLDLTKLGGLTLDEPAIKSLGTGLSFQNPIQLGVGAPTLSVAAGAHASLQIIGADSLPGHGDSVEALPDTCYVSFSMEATASASVGATAAGIQFGAAPSTKLELTSYSRFPLKAGITLLHAMEQTVTGFSLPVHSGDLADLPAGNIARVAVSGALKLSGSANLLAITNPLASVALPAPLPTVSVSAGGSITAGVSCEIDAEYEMVARKLDSGAVRLGWYHKKGGAIDVHAKGVEGISGGFNGTDLFSMLLGAISSSPKADLKELAAAGVPDHQASAIQGAVQAAANRKVEVAMAAAISASASEAATFLFEIVPAALAEESRQAVDKALHGDLTGLHAPELAGVTCVRSIWETVRKSGLELDVNLLGILNYRSIANLALEGKVVCEPITGSVVITDQATAERIGVTQVNVGPDAQKLRHVLAESFLITAAYHGAKQIPNSAQLRCSHSFFEQQSTTSRGEMARKLQTGVAVGLLTLDEAAPPAGIDDFGRTLFSVSTDYDGDLIGSLFLDGGDQPLSREVYETAGRAAIQFVVGENDEDAVRRRPAIEDALWNRMKEVGTPSFASLFLGVRAPYVGAIASDYSTIRWWADAMHDTARKLAEVRLWLAQHPGVTLEDAGFQQLRDDLAGFLRDVAATTRDEFGQPWGLIAMDQVVNRRAGAKFLVSGSKLVVSKSTKLAAAIGS